MNNAANFRPFSIVPIVCKIFEIIIKDRLVSYSYFDKHMIITLSQFGFRRQTSTIKTLTHIIITEGFDEEHDTIAVLCDLTEAFDCVNVDILVAQLEYYGVRRVSLQLFRR